MGWRKALFRDKDVWVEVDGEGRPAGRGGRVPIRYSKSAGARVYRAAERNVAIKVSAPVEDLPDGVSADAAKKGGKKKGRGSGFGKAGTRSKAQAAAAAADARSQLEALPDDTVVCFTDGACKGNPGRAGSGAVVQLPDGRQAEASRALGHATNNIAELTAIDMALDLLDEAEVAPDAAVALFTDSKYSNGVLCLGWKAKANRELILGLRERLAARPGVEIRWVAGHVGVEGNERADDLANLGVDGVTGQTHFA
jgi:ribonuclease HI